jgi:hypothetical protein
MNIIVATATEARGRTIVAGISEGLPARKPQQTLLVFVDQ